MLRDSIRDYGILQPLLVRSNVDPQQVIEGCHRLEISLDLSIQEVPCILIPMTEMEVLKLQLICHAKRIEVEPIEYATRLWKIINVEQTMSLNELAHSLSQHPDWVKRILNLVNLSQLGKKYLTKGKIAIKMGAELSKLPVQRQDSILELMESLSKSELRELIRSEIRQLRSDKKSSRILTNLKSNYRLRNLKEVKYELEFPTVAASVLSGVDAASALDGWKAALKWCTRTDKASLATELERRELLEAKEAELLKKRISEQSSIEREKTDE